MNIFVTDPDPFVSASNLDDSRVIKMFLESCQLLSTVAHGRGRGEGFYKPTHVRHPLTLWLQADDRHLAWLLAHTTALGNEYSVRFDKTHASQRVLKLAHHLFFDVVEDPNIEFVNCARNLAENVDFSHISDVPTAYRMYLNERWKRAIAERVWNPRKKLPKWTNAIKPGWVEI